MDAPMMRRKDWFYCVAFVVGVFLLCTGGCQQGQSACSAAEQSNTDWVRLFNGKDLAGWDGDPCFWSVKDGVIHGETTVQNRAKNNTFLVWRGGSVRDFELKLKFKIASGNSGVQFRCTDIGATRGPKWNVCGYQAEVCNEQPQVGFLYEEGTRRGGLVRTGQFVVLDQKGDKHSIRRIADPNELIKAEYYKPNDWNEYHIIAMGNHIVLKLNGVKTAELIDNDPIGRALEGLIALQIHMGPPMMVEFKDIFLKRYKSAFESAVVLFDGKGLDKWTLVPGAWEIEKDGILAGKGKENIWTNERYGDFILDLEFRLPPNGNSGVFFRTADVKDEVQTGIEVQLFDSYTRGGTYDVTKGSCGAVYACQAPSRNVVNKPMEWNRMTIAAIANWINVTLNDVPIVDMDLDRWTEAHKNPDGSQNKFNTAYKDTARSGYIGFQYHNNPVWFRNVRIVPLDK